MEVLENEIFSFKEKLKLLKGEFGVWNKEVFRFLDLVVEEGIKEMNILNFVVANEGSVDVEVMALKRGLTSKRVWQSIFEKDSMLRKKEKQKWLVEGDSNSKFFPKL